MPASSTAHRDRLLKKKRGNQQRGSRISKWGGGWGEEYEVIYVRPTVLSTQSLSTNIAARRFSCCASPIGIVFPH